jgi:hypothetical protein
MNGIKIFGFTIAFALLTSCVSSQRTKTRLQRQPPNDSSQQQTIARLQARRANELISLGENGLSALELIPPASTDTPKSHLIHIVWTRGGSRAGDDRLRFNGVTFRRNESGENDIEIYVLPGHYTVELLEKEPDGWAESYQPYHNAGDVVPGSSFTNSLGVVRQKWIHGGPNVDPWIRFQVQGSWKVRCSDQIDLQPTKAGSTLDLYYGSFDGYSHVFLTPPLIKVEGGKP